MIVQWALAILGLVILLLAGDALVRGAVNLALRLGIPALIVSLTVVAFGTSAPELLISVKAVLEDAPGIALGNVVGSNIANILLVLGVPALLKGLDTAGCDSRHSYVLMLGVSLLFVGLAVTGPITWVDGLILLAALGYMLADQYMRARAHRAAGAPAQDALVDEEIEGLEPEMPWWRVIALLLAGLVGLPLGADILVDSSVAIARTYGISETVIGLTLVAVGTSMPELATTLMAAFRGKAEVALGNVIGSNIFNLAAIIGIAALVGEIPVDPSFLRLDFWVMIGASLLVGPAVMLRWNLTRPAGALLTALYAGYLWALLV